jgi:23S rRNA (cytosine1962-C5)-methyltransferase
LIIEVLQDKLKLKTILEKSNMPSRREEGLGDSEALLFGQEAKEVEILENGYKFKVDLTDSQKTGFFLDQREMRQLAGHLATDKSILNCFAYTGAFSIYAAKNKAKNVDTVEISAQALGLAKLNFKENNLNPNDKKFNFYQQDVFEFLRQTRGDYDFIILDPPAFAKKKKDIIPACRGYKDINRLALKLLKTPGYLLTSSCSYYVAEDLFRKVVFQAALEANKNVRIIQKHILAFDHPINIYQPESEYLKSFLLYCLQEVSYN